MALFQEVLSSLRPVIVALIAGAGLSILLNAVFPGAMTLAQTDWIAAGIFIAALIALRKGKLNPILVIFASGAAGLGLYLLV